MASDPHITDMLAGALKNRGDIERKKMFGGNCWLLNGNMLCGDGEGRFMFRVGKDQQDAALKNPGAEIVAFNGRKMGGILWVREEDALAYGLDNWITLAERFVRTLPAK
ncbi:TfoX/Sxy family protein [Sphingorhabdus sp. Alg239-R122]|uniref:TfoX/Sxy family protein n=1 Tax=Sphingorhabdus sp. Alg239-R122 TaxID=2305989 RepID=UPI0013DBF437|nr:TfoX/Sxy family protein [Sphingorhabdus sp. Alg239-R122]